MLTAADLAARAAPLLARRCRRVPAEDVAWVAERALRQRAAEHPELRHLDPAARRAVWQSWTDDLAAAVAHRAAAL